MTVDFCYQLFQDILAKNQQGYVPPEQFNRMMTQAQLSYLDFLLGDFRQYSPGRAVAQVEIGMNQIVRQRLSPFIALPSEMTIDGTGYVAYPINYEQIDAMYWGGNDGTKMERIRWVGQEYLYSTLDSVIDPVETNPIYLITRYGFQFYPTNLINIKISYVQRPPDIKWGYTIQNGKPIYDSINSVDPLWHDTDMFEIIARALAMAGVALQAPMISQFANNIIKTGQ